MIAVTDTPNKVVSFQIFRPAVIILCIMINILDGFDILAMSFAGPAISSEWTLTSTQTGSIFSVALAGMMGGAFGFAALADIKGRRLVILLCLGLSGVGMLATGWAESLPYLLLARLLTGLGVGGLMPTLNTMIAEAASAKYRNLVVVLQAAGYPLGGVLGGLVAIQVIPQHGWPTLMFIGCAVAVALFVAAYMYLPESAQYLARTSPAVGEQNGDIADDFGCRAGVKPSVSGRMPLSILFSTSFRSSLLVLSAIAFLVQFSFYFFLSWTPSILTNAGLSVRMGIAGAVWMSLGGIVADLLFAGAAMRCSVRILGMISMIAAFFTVLLLTAVLTHPSLLFLMAVAVGGFLFASMASIYSLAPVVLPVFVRASGTGIALSVGRLGGVFGPLVGALLMADQRLSVFGYLSILAAPLLLAGFLMLLLPRKAY